MKLNLRKSVSRRTATVAIAASTAVIMTAGVASAFVLGKGAANGNAAVTSAASHQDLTFSLGTFDDLNIEPGESGKATLTITNPNNYKTKIGSLEITGVTVTGADSAALGTVDVKVGTTANGAVLDKSGTVTAVVTVSISDSATVDQTSLLGKTVSFTVKTA